MDNTNIAAQAVVWFNLWKTNNNVNYTWKHDGLEKNATKQGKNILLNINMRNRNWMLREGSLMGRQSTGVNNTFVVYLKAAMKNLIINCTLLLTARYNDAT